MRPQDQQQLCHSDSTVLAASNTHIDFMQTVDEPEQASRLGFDLPSTYIIQQNPELVNLNEALGVDGLGGQMYGAKRLSLSTLVIDLALALRRKYQVHIKKHEAKVDFDMLT